jgi:hypothetical protein
VGREGEEFVVWAEVMGAVGWACFPLFFTGGIWAGLVSGFLIWLVFLGDLSLAVPSSYPGVGVENCGWARMVSFRSSGIVIADSGCIFLGIRYQRSTGFGHKPD